MRETERMIDSEKKDNRPTPTCLSVSDRFAHLTVPSFIHSAQCSHALIDAGTTYPSSHASASC